MPYTGSPPTFTAGQKTGVAAGLNDLRDFARAFTDAWTAYTPTLTADTTNPTNFTATGYYVRAGKLVIAKFQIVAGASFTAGSGYYRVAMPAAAATAIDGTPVSNPINLIHGSSQIWGAGYIPASDSQRLYIQYQTSLTALGLVGHTSPWSWASGDVIRGQAIYEAA